MHPPRHISPIGPSLATRDASVFERDRYVVFRPSLLEAEISRMYQYACYTVVTGATASGDNQVPETPCSYGDPVMDALLNRLLPEVEAISGLLLFPTYSYFRVYKTADVLKRHIDRFACEISVSLCLGYDAEEPWPIWIEGPHGVRSISLKTAEALVYRGMECPHWREEFCGKRLVQVFLHYVDRNGPNAEWKFDKRKSLSCP
jgi:hypothetical protein